LLMRAARADISGLKPLRAAYAIYCRSSVMRAAAGLFCRAAAMSPARSSPTLLFAFTDYRLADVRRRFTRYAPRCAPMRLYAAVISPFRLLLMLPPGDARDAQCHIRLLRQIPQLFIFFAEKDIAFFFASMLRLPRMSRRRRCRFSCHIAIFDDASLSFRFRY